MRNNRRRHRRAIAYAAAVGVATVALSVTLTVLPTTASVITGPAIPASAIPQLSSGAWRLATMSGDPRPASITAVAVNYGRALSDATPGDRVPRSPSQMVYLVVLVGKFRLNAPVPRGAPLPTGKYLVVTIDPATGRIMDLGLTDHTPPVPLARYGPVTNLMRQR